MTNLDLAKYKSLYLKTAREHLIDLKKNLFQLNQNPTDQHLIYEVFRLFHSVKSQNYFMGFEKTANFCKALESFFRAIKEGKRNYDPTKSQVIQDTFTKLENSLANIEKDNTEIDLSQDIINLEEKLGVNMSS